MKTLILERQPENEQFHLVESIEDFFLGSKQVRSIISIHGSFFLSRIKTLHNGCWFGHILQILDTSQQGRSCSLDATIEHKASQLRKNKSGKIFFFFQILQAKTGPEKLFPHQKSILLPFSFFCGLRFMANIVPSREEEEDPLGSVG